MEKVAGKPAGDWIPSLGWEKRLYSPIPGRVRSDVRRGAYYAGAIGFEMRFSGALMGIFSGGQKLDVDGQMLRVGSLVTI